MPGFFCQSAHRVGERQRRAVVGKTETAREAPPILAELPIGKLRQVAGAFFRREWLDSASTRNARTLRERNHVAI
jgi:hypothetical protein